MTSAPGSDMLVKILTTYPELSAEWLMTGRGEMLKSNCSKGSDMRTFQDNTYSIIKSKAPEFTPIKQNKIIIPHLRPVPVFHLTQRLEAYRWHWVPCRKATVNKSQ